MTPEDLLELVATAGSEDAFFETHIVKPIPWIFDGKQALFDAWRDGVAADAGVRPENLYIVGSASTGYSLSPTKALRPFKAVMAGELYPSDIDVAVIDATLFTAAWNDIVKNDRGRILPMTVTYVAPRLSTSQLLDQIRLNVYKGFVSDATVIRGSATAAKVLSVINGTSRRPPFRGYRPRARLYRRYEDFRSYHQESLRQLVAGLKP